MRKKLPIWIYSTSAFNRLVDLYFRNRIVAALALEAAPWRHPWFTTVRWDDEEETWLATVKPGACVSASSDGDPVVRVDQVHAPAETVERLGLEPGEDARNGRGYLSEGAPLALSPALFRSIGTDAIGTESLPAEAVPAFFAERGVMGARVLRDGGGAAVIQTDGLVSARRRARLLRACDLVLTHDRPATTAAARASDLSPGTVALEFSTGRATSYDAEPQLVARAKWENPADLAALDLALGTGTDSGRDEIRLATVYLLGPPGMEEGALPEGREWAAFVKHHVHWNLQYATRLAAVEVEPTRLETPIPILGAGELGRWGAAMTGEINGRIAEIESAMASVRNQGRFLML